METTPQTEPRWTGLKEVLGMSYPILIGSLSVTIMGFVDQIFVSRLGDAALAAVGTAGLWAYTSTTFMLGAIGCVSTFVSQSVGRGENHQCGSYAWQGMYIATIMSVLVLILWPLTPPLFHFMNHAPDVTQLEIVYFRIRLVGFIFYAWMVALIAFFQAVGRPGIAAWAGVVGNVTNAIFAYVLVFGKFGFPQLGVTGAALGVVFGTAAEMVVLQTLFLSKYMDDEYGTRRGYAPDLVKLRELFRIGWPAGLASFMDVFNWALFTGFVVGGLGKVALAAHNVAISFMHVSFMPAVGIHNAIAPIVGQYIGRQDIPRAKARTYTAIRLTMAYMLTMGVIMGVFGQHLIRFCFSPSEEVVDVGHKLLILAALFQGFDAINIVTMGALRGAGDTRWMAVLSVIGGYCIFLPAAVYLAYPFGGGAVGAWAGATVYIIGLSGVIFGRFYGERWRHIRIFSNDQVAANPE